MLKVLLRVQQTSLLRRKDLESILSINLDIYHIQGANSNHVEEKLDSFLENALGSGKVTNGTIAMEPSQMQYIWSLRERIAESLVAEGYSYNYDVSLPQNEFYKIVDNMRNHLGDSVVRCCGFGPLGDGNLHLSIVTKEFEKDITNSVQSTLYEWTAQVNGSISAEHGLGFTKKNFIHFSKSSGAINLMKQIKALMDPNGILNPYKVLPEN